MPSAHLAALPSESADLSGTGRSAARWRIALGFLGALVFVLTFVFFTRVCMLVPSDSDDWLLMAKARSGLPEWGAFNPSKVLPETLLHGVNYLAGFFVMPLVGGDYVWSLVIAAALIVSALVTAYVLVFALLLGKRVRTGLWATACVSAIFYLAHFVLLSHVSGGTVPYLLGSRDYTGYFHYTIPYLVCATVAMGIDLRGPGVRPREDYDQRDRWLPLIVLGIYLGMFSNLFLNIVLAAFLGASLVASLLHVGDAERCPWSVRAYVRANALHFCVLALWLVTLAYELSGNRASGALDGGDGLHVVAVLSDVGTTLACLNRGLVLLMCLDVICGVGLCMKVGRDSTQHAMAQGTFVCILSFLLTSLFVVLLSSVMDPYTQSIPPTHYYASRSDVLVTAAFPCLVLGCLALGFLMERIKPATAVAPVAVFVIAVSAINCIGRYEEPVRGGIDDSATLAAAEDMVGQVYAADEAGQTSVEVHVLAFMNDFSPNWPLGPGMANGLANDLYAAGVTTRRMDITLVPDASVNVRLGLSREIGASAPVAQ